MTLTELRAFVAKNYPSLTVHRNGETCFGATSILDFNSSLTTANAKAAINAGLLRHAAAFNDLITRIRNSSGCKQ